MKDSNIINDGIRVKKGDVTVGTHIERLIINLYRDSSPLQLDDKELRELRDAYLGYLRQQCQTLDFKGIRLPEAVEKTAGLSLRDVYVPVRTRLELPEGETWQRIAGRYWKGDAATEQAMPTRVRPAEVISIKDMINNYPALVILGDPGAGKSTLLKYLALNLATVEAGVLPILVPLNAYSKALQENTSLNLSDFLPRYFAGRQHQLKGLNALFQVALDQGKAVVLLDGLDEVVAERGRVVALVDDFIREYLPEPKAAGDSSQENNRIIATSRFVGYREAPLRDTRWRTAALVDWEKEEIERFVERFTLAVETLVAGGENEDVHRQAEREKQSLLNSIFGHEGIERRPVTPCC